MYPMRATSRLIDANLYTYIYITRPVYLSKSRRSSFIIIHRQQFCTLCFILILSHTTAVFL